MGIIAMGMGSVAITITVIISIIAFIILVALVSRYRRCPADKVLVVYGKVGKGDEGDRRSARCIHEDGRLVWPIIQDYQYLDLKPMSIDVNLVNALSKQ